MNAKNEELEDQMLTSSFDLFQTMIETIEKDDADSPLEISNQM